MSARKNLDKIVVRSQGLAPVPYTVTAPGILVIQLNFLAIKSRRSVEAVILNAIEDYCYVEMLLSGDAQ